MFYAIDKVTNEIVLSLDIREKNYKDTYNKELKYKCAGYCDDGNDCDDNNIIFVNSKVKQPHFRHSVASKCSAHRAYLEFNHSFYADWFSLFESRYRKPYWYNCKLEQIRNDDTVIMIRYSLQKSASIRYVEKYSKSKVIWILALENRTYENISHHNGSLYIDFIGSKNDIPLFDDNKSKVYLDTGTDMLLKVKLNSTCYVGQEIKCINICDLCKKHDHLFASYPYRRKNYFLRNLVKEKEDFLRNLVKKKEEEQIRLLEQIKKKEQEEHDRIILLEQLRKKKERLIKKREIRRNKALKLMMDAEKEMIIIKERLKLYEKKYDLNDDNLVIRKLLEIIDENYNDILTKASIIDKSSLEYIKKYYTFITFPLNHNIDKMISYIMTQEDVLPDE